MDISEKGKKMTVDKEQTKKKIYEKLPDLLPKLLKTVIVHIVMMIYHISMPPWVTAIKIKKGLKSHKNVNERYEEETKRGRRIRRRINHRQRW